MGHHRLIRSQKITKFDRKTGDVKITLYDIFSRGSLTKRDKAVLLSLYYHRCLTSNQIAEMHFKYDKNGKLNTQAHKIARRRLRKLFDLQVVERFFIDMPAGEGSSPQHVMLDQLGARMVAGMLNTTVEELEWRYEMNERRLPYLEHMVGVNDFYIYLLNAAREYGHRVENYLVENHVRHEFLTGKRKKVKFNPDAYGQYFVNKDEGFHFFLEWDNGTMTLQTFRNKLYRYNAFYRTGEYKKYYGESFPLILVVAPDVDRAVALRNTIYVSNTTGLQWLFTTKELAETAPLEAIWLGADKNPVSLIQSD